MPRGGFIAANDDVDIQGIEFDTAADAAGGLACDQRRAGSQERVEHDLAFLRQIVQRLDQHRGGLDRWVVLEPLSRIGALRRRARIGPEVRSMASFPTELDIVDVSDFAFLEDRQKLVLRSVEMTTVMVLPNASLKALKPSSSCLRRPNGLPLCPGDHRVAIGGCP